MSLPPQSILMFAMIPLVLWRVYSRVRRLVGRQTSSPGRQWLTICIFPFFAVLLGSVSKAEPYAVLALLGGIAIGCALGVLGHRLTKFEQTPDGLFYTPNAHLGIALSLLLVGRILYRLIEGAINTPAADTPALPTPLTLALFGMLAGYYVTYAIGLVLWRRAVAGNGAV